MDYDPSVKIINIRSINIKAYEVTLEDDYTYTKIGAHCYGFCSGSS